MLGEKNKPIRHPGLDPGPLSASAWPAARDPGLRRDDEETETLHPHIRPFGHRVTLTTAPAKETHRQCSAQTGNDPGRCAPLGGFGWGVKGGAYPTRKMPSARTRLIASSRIARVLRSTNSKTTESAVRDFVGFVELISTTSHEG